MTDVPSAHSCHRAILIADIVGSTELYESVGDALAKRRVGACLESLRQAVEGHSGRVVKHLGDGMLCAFESDLDAVLAALEMCERNNGQGLAIRVGVNAGQVLEDGGDVFGDAVNTAARISARARPMEILVSGELEASLSDELRSQARPVPPLTVKGKRDPLRLLALWSDQASTSSQGPAETLCLTQPADPPTAEIRVARLALSYLDKSLTLVGEEQVTIGRDTDCNLSVSSRHASRLHARVFGRGGRFVLADQSSNGTFLIQGRRTRLHLVREEAILYGAGSIYLGEDPEKGEIEPVRYRIL